MFVVKKVGKRVEMALRSSGMGVMPTDTIYGIVGSALSEKAVERIYRLRRRDRKKPMIILIGSLAQLKLFGIHPGIPTLKHLRHFWPGKVSIVLRIDDRGSWIRFKYLHRGTRTLAFRLPKTHWLRKLLARVGPLVAPSANTEGEPLARTIAEAKKYFGDKVDFYVEAGRRRSRPSMLIALNAGGKAKVLRKSGVRAG